MPVHQMRHFPLLEAQQFRDFALLKLLFGQQLVHVKAKLCARQQLVGVLQTQIGIDIAGPFLELRRLLSLALHVWTSPSPPHKAVHPSPARIARSFAVRAATDDATSRPPPEPEESRGDWRAARGRWPSRFARRGR